jgi:molybdopterin converting factor small subunit
MQVNIVIFGNLTDITGSNSIPINDVKDTTQLLQELHHRYPALAAAKYIVAVDKQVINTNTLLQHNSTVALLPPFSGG